MLITKRDYIQNANMFHILDAQYNGEQNARCLEYLYQKFDEVPQGRLSKKSLLEYLESFFLSEDRNPTEKVSHTLSTFLKYQYLQENYINQDEYYELTRNARIIIATLKKLNSKEEIEYSSLLLNIYSLFSNNLMNESPYTVLYQGMQMTKQIEEQLQILLSEIKNRIIEYSKEMDLSQIYISLDDFHNKGSFKKFIHFKKEYAKRQMDFFMTSTLKNIQSSDTFLQQAIAQCMENKDITKEDATKDVYQLLYYLMRKYNGELEQRIQIIFQTINIYYSRAIIRAKLSSSTQQNTLSEELRFIYKNYQKIGKVPDSFFSFYSSKLYDPLNYHYFSKYEQIEREKPAELMDEKEMSELLQAEKDRQKKDSFFEINQRIQTLLRTKKELTEKDLPILSNDDLEFISLVFTFQYNSERCYDVKISNKIYETDFAKYPCFTIRRRECE